jgi:ubiquinone/menaquinone biosynthesis C-methylase UbiE
MYSYSTSASAKTAIENPSPQGKFDEDEFQLWGPMKPSVLPLWKRFFPKESPLEFLRIMERFLKPEHEVLEVGAGVGHFFPHSIRGTVKRLVGIDPDPRTSENPQLDEAVIGTCEEMQFPDGCFDIVFHRMLAEHLPDPELATIEIARVLKPGGLLMIHTPNKRHYSMLVSRYTPMWFHRAFMQFLGTRKDSKDVHFAYYRMNSSKDIRRICRKAGLEILELRFILSPPGYLRFSPVTFLAGTLYTKVVEQLIPGLRQTIVLVARKPSEAH